MYTKNSIEILQDLIRIDSQNPPGNEKFVVGYIQEFCENLGVAHQIYTYEEQRSNIIIRIGKQCDDNLIILGHLDVVCAKAEDWTQDPLGAELVDGYIYGRGALDMKYFIATSMVVMRELKEIEETLDRGITFIFAADEERGSSFGMQRLLQEEGIAEELRGKIVLNEGGGFSVPYQGTCPYLFETGQKSVCRLRVTIPEEAYADPYFPTLTHEATLVQVLKNLEQIIIDDQIPKTSERLMERFSDHQSTGDPFLSKLLRTMSSSIISPTLIHGGARNKTTGPHIRGTIDFDCRLLPGITQETFIEKVELSLQDLPVVINVESFTEGYEADVDKKIITLMRESLQKFDPTITDLVPFITPGSNDGKFLKPLGCEVLGFAPLHRDDTFTSILPLIHGIDERISTKSVSFCEKVLHEVCINYLIGDKYIG